MENNNIISAAKIRRSGFGSVIAESMSKVNGTFPSGIFWKDEAEGVTAKDFQNLVIGKQRKTGKSFLSEFDQKVFYKVEKGLKYNWTALKDLKWK